MKYIQFVLLASFIFCTPKELLSQHFDKIGAKVALTSSTLDYSDFGYQPSHRRIGYNIAIFSEWSFTSHFFIVSQLEYSQRGAGDEFNRRDEFNNDLGNVTYYSKLDYLSIPILAKYTILTGSVAPAIILGQRVDFLVDRRSDEDYNKVLLDSFKKSVFGGTVGVGVEVKEVLPANFLLEFRYNIDFTDSDDMNTASIRNDAFDIWLGIFFK